MTHSRPLLRSLGLIGVLALAGVAGAGEAAVDARQGEGAPDQATNERETHAGGCPVLLQAQALLDDAGEISASATSWVRANVSPGALMLLARGAGAAAECRWESLVDRATLEVQREFGTSFYSPGCGTLGCGEWTPLADLAPGVDRSRVVLLVHGLDEPGDIWNDLAPTLSEAGLTVARFNYPNDQDPAASAVALAEAMRALKADLRVEHVDLVCHSMGGLVARDVLTRPAYYAGDASAHDGLPAVGHLITIGTPNHGSALAPLRSLGEIREHVARWMDTDMSSVAALLGCLADGDGGAADALEPCSDYLKDLNGRALPANVDMTVIIGRISPLTEGDVDDALSGSWVQCVLGSSRTQRLCAQAGEVISTLGDAVVTEGSARLDGVSDTVVLEGNHRSLVRRMPLLDSLWSLVGEHNPTPPAIPVVVSRLTAQPE